MPARKLTYSGLLKMAQQYGVADNVLFTSACARYEYIVGMVKKLNAQVEQDGLMIERINVKGDTNLEANPLIAQIPKYMDTANKTLSSMLDIIQRQGREKQESRFGDMDE